MRTRQTSLQIARNSITEILVQNGDVVENNNVVHSSSPSLANDFKNRRVILEDKKGLYIGTVAENIVVDQLTTTILYNVQYDPANERDPTTHNLAQLQQILLPIGVDEGTVE